MNSQKETNLSLHFTKADTPTLSRTTLLFYVFLILTHAMSEFLWSLASLLLPD